MTKPEKTQKAATVAGIRKRATLMRQLRAAVPAAGARAKALLRRWPAALAATRTGVERTSAAVQAMPSSTLRSLAAGSAGLGAGLLIGGAPRLVAAAGVAPAIVMSAAVLARSGHPNAVRADSSGPGAGKALDESRLDDDGGPAAA